MATPDEEALVGRVVEVVTSLLEGVLESNAETVTALLAPESLLGIGLALFGIDAVVVPLGLATRPHHLGLTAVQAGADQAVAEVRGLDEHEQEVCVSSVFLTRQDEAWRVDDIWPVPADGEMDLESIPEPTVLFYTGQLQLAVLDDAMLDTVEAVLLPALQGDEMGLHLIERGVHLWRSFNSAAAPSLEAPAGWAASIHFAVLALDAREPDPEEVAALYGVLAETVVEHFMQIVTQMGFAPDEGPAIAPVAPPPSSGLVDLSGRPLSTGRPGENRRDRPAGGIILPRG